MTYDNARLDRLESATKRLSDNVIGLSTSLALVTEIGNRQAETERRATLAEAKADKAITKEQLDAGIEALDQVRKSRNLTYFLVALALVVSLAVAIGYTRLKTVEQINDRLRASNSACEAANKRTNALIGVLDRFATLSTQAETKSYFTDASKQIAATRSDCDALFPLPEALRDARGAVTSVR